MSALLAFADSYTNQAAELLGERAVVRLSNSFERLGLAVGDAHRELSHLAGLTHAPIDPLSGTTVSRLPFQRAPQPSQA